MELKGARETGLLVGLLVVASRGVDGPPLWAAAALIVGVAVAGTLNVLGELRFWRNAPAATLPALAAFAAVGGAHLLPVQLLVVAAPATVGGVIVAMNLSVDLVRAAVPDPAAVSDDEVSADVVPTADAPADDALAGAVSEEGGPGPSHAILQAAAFGLGFLALAAVGGVVPNGLGGSGSTLTPLTLVATVVLDAVVAGVMGYRLVALSGLGGRRAAVAANHYVAIGGHLGALVRVLNLPRLVGPGILIVVLYVWFEIRHSRMQAARREPLAESSEAAAEADPAASAS